MRGAVEISNPIDKIGVVLFFPNFNFIFFFAKIQQMKSGPSGSRRWRGKLLETMSGISNDEKIKTFFDYCKSNSRANVVEKCE